MSPSLWVFCLCVVESLQVRLGSLAGIVLVFPSGHPGCVFKVASAKLTAQVTLGTSGSGSHVNPGPIPSDVRAAIRKLYMTSFEPQDLK